MNIFKVPKYFDFNCGPKWSVIAHYRGFGLGVRHEYTRIRILLGFWQIVFDA